MEDLVQCPDCRRPMSRSGEGRYSCYGCGINATPLSARITKYDFFLIEGEQPFEQNFPVGSFIARNKHSEDQFARDNDSG